MLEASTYIIIATYNGISWIPDTFQKLKNFMVIIVDNESTDGTLPYIIKNFPNFILLKQKKNLGFGKANNIGISYALREGAEHVFLLNQDAWIDPDQLYNLISLQKRKPEYGIISPIHLNGTGDKLDRHFSTYMSYDANSDFYSDFVLSKTKQEIYDVPFVNAAGWLLSKKLLNNIGGFDPMFHHYGEDQNYCQRARYHGFKIGVVPDCFLYHDREVRIGEKIKEDRISNLKRKEREIKIKFGNVHSDKLSLLKKNINKQKKAILKTYLKFQFVKAQHYREELCVLMKCAYEIELSLEKNKCSGPNYLGNVPNS